MEATEILNNAINNTKITKAALATAIEKALEIMAEKEKNKPLAQVLEEKAKGEMEAKVEKIKFDKLSIDSVINGVQDALAQLLSEINSNQEMIETQTAEHDLVTNAIAEKRRELDTLCNLQTAILDFDAFVQASEITKKEQKLAIEVLIEEFKVKKAELEAEYQNTSNELEQMRAKEQEEYHYDLKRKRLKEKDEIDDLQDKRERNLNERERYLDEKSMKISALSDENSALLVEVENTQHRIDEAVAKAITKTTDDLNAKHSNEINLINVTNVAEIEKLQLRNDMLTARIEEQRKEIAELKERLKSANTDVRTIAAQAIEGAKVPKFTIENSRNDK